jgi:hypothetical protein
MSKGKRSKAETKIKYAGSVVACRIAIVHNIESASLKQLEEIAHKCGVLRSELWNTYGSLKSWAINKYEIDKQFRYCTSVLTKYTLIKMRLKLL